ncbi:MAG: hypothetical protein ACOC16_02715 [Nanoarchaeota archaeon]
MVIDIDSFLDGLSEKDIEVNNEVQKDKKISLDFQKEVEDKIRKTKQEYLNKDFEALKEIYDEVKSFDQDLPNKFSGIKNQSKIALEELGDKYTKEYLKIAKDNAKHLSDKIEHNFKILNEQLDNHNYSKALETFRYILKGYSYFPKNLLEERVEIYNRIKSKEIEIFTSLKKFKKRKKDEISKNLKKIIFRIANQIKNYDYLHEIEKSAHEFKLELESIPDVLSVLLIEEKIYSTKFLIKVENYLFKRYKKEVEIRKNNIDDLSEKFYKNYIKKDIDSVLLIYNEILLEFKSMPDCFIEEKIQIYQKINKLFNSINKLMISLNMTQLVKSYEYSKKIESIKEFLYHIQYKKNIDINTLNQLKNKVEKLPNNFNFEKDDLLRKINEIISKAYNNQNNMLIQQGQNEIFKETEQSRNISIESKSNDSYTEKKKKHILEEIDKLHQAIIKEKNHNKIEVLYNKIIFHIKNLNIDKSQKLKMIAKLKQTLKNKKII